MNKRVSLGDIIFLVVALAVLVLLWWLFSPPRAFVFSCLAAGAAIPILSRIARKLLPKPYWMLPTILVMLVVVFPVGQHYFPDTADKRFVLFYGTFFSAFAVGVCIVEFSLRPFFPIRRADKQT